LFLLAAFRFPKIPNYLVIALALLVMFRVATVEQMFLAQQGELKQLSSAFDSIPRNARVIQLARQEQGSVIMGRGDIHHLDYGVIQRGFLVPSLFHLEGVQPLRLADNLYCPNIFCYVWSATADTDWDKIAESYDYLWVAKGTAFTDLALRIGDPVFSNDAVTVYRIRRARTE
jgi:hypothetical protein